MVYSISGFLRYMLCFSLVCFLPVIIVFSFKQKTAYEMRIIDLSSDVCSSDLAAALSLTLLLAILATLDSWSATLSWSDTLHLRAVLTPLSAMVAILVPTIALPVLVYAAAQERRPGKIGSASCRERGCQYV